MLPLPISVTYLTQRIYNKRYLLMTTIWTCILVGFVHSRALAEGQNEHLTNMSVGSIVTTTGMIADITEQVAGDRYQVSGLMGAGVDPHLYKATRSDIATLSRADIVFYNGLHLEGRLIDALNRVKLSGRQVFPVTELLGPDYLLAPKEFSNSFDPHVWMDPLAWSEAVEVVRSKLVQLDPQGADFYNTNARSYKEQLAQLHAYVDEIISSIPKGSRVLITAHDAFNYFGRRYNLEVMGIQGISTESEAGIKDIERLVSLLVERQIPAVFVESTVSQRNLLALLEGAAAKGHKVTIGGELFSDAMGKPGTYEGTYIGMIDHNATTIAHALGGRAPKTGFLGKLSNN